MTDRQASLFTDMPRPAAHQVAHHHGTAASQNTAQQLEARGELTECYVRTLRWIWRWPDQTYRQLAANARQIGVKCADQEPARRFSLLVDAGMIRETGRVRCPIGGTNCTTHRITEAGLEFLRDRDARGTP